MADLTPAETLRAAAKKLRESESRTLGNGRPWRYAPGKPSDSVRTESGWEIVYGDDPNNLRWIALMSPAVAEPFAAWLEGVTERHNVDPDSDYPDRCLWCVEPWPCPDLRDALAVARTILGRTS